MDTYKYITLTFIALSASGLQGICYLQTIQKYAPQVTQKLNQYRYHIGGALALAGLTYGGYKVWKAMDTKKHTSYTHTECNVISPTKSPGAPKKASHLNTEQGQANIDIFAQHTNKTPQEKFMRGRHEAGLSDGLVPLALRAGICNPKFSSPTTPLTLNNQEEVSPCWRISCDPCKITYEFNPENRTKNIPKNVNITSVLCYGKQLTLEEVRQRSWNTEHERRALENFDREIRTFPLYDNDTVRFTYDSHVHAIERWGAEINIHDIVRSLLIPGSLLISSSQPSNKPTAASTESSANTAPLSPYRIGYRTTLGSSEPYGPYHTVVIESIFHNNQSLLDQACVRKIPWNQCDGRAAIAYFIQQAQEDLKKKYSPLPTTRVCIIYSGHRYDTTIQTMCSREIERQLACGLTHAIGWGPSRNNN